MTTDKNESAIANARAWVESITAAMDALESLMDDADERDSVTFEGETFDDAETLRERIEQMPLSLQVRGGWYLPGADKPDAEEFELLLSTGGPALRITGEIGGEHSLQWQDWGTPWTDYRATSDYEDLAIADFVGLFGFGE